MTFRVLKIKLNDSLAWGCRDICSSWLLKEFVQPLNDIAIIIAPPWLPRMRDDVCVSNHECFIAIIATTCEQRCWSSLARRMRAQDNNSLRHTGRMSLTKPLPYFVVAQCFEDLHVPRSGARISGGYHIAFYVVTCFFLKYAFCL